MALLIVIDTALVVMLAMAILIVALASELGYRAQECPKSLQLKTTLNFYYLGIYHQCLIELIIVLNVDVQKIGINNLAPLFIMVCLDSSSYSLKLSPLLLAQLEQYLLRR